MNRIGRTLRISFMNQNSYTNLRGGDHVDVDILIVKSLEHLCRHTRIGHHARTNDGYLCHFLVAGNAFAADTV